MSSERRWIWGLSLALLVSVGINLVVAGFVVGRGLAPPERRMGRLVEHIAAKLPDADQPILRQAFRAEEAAMRARSAELREARRAVRAVLRAEPFDPAALEAALERQRREMDAMMGSIHATVRDIAPRLSPEGRKRLAEIGPPDHRDRRAEERQRRREAEDPDDGPPPGPPGMLP